MSARAPRPAAAAAALFVALALTGFPAAAASSAALEARLDGISSRGLPPGCLYEGRWYSGGAVVPTGEACLQCACAEGALSCRRRACAALPDAPPRRCHVLHRRGACCPELHCPDGVQLMEHGAFARSEDEEDITPPRSPGHACVEGGTVYAAGSAMRSARACEQCFCLRGARRCVQPACLPPPAGCRARAAPGLCCPQRYYCEHSTKTTKAPHEKHPHDCKVEGKWVSEGEKIVEGAGSDNCTACFCLRGAVQCQALACAPALMGCTPRLRAGHCCAHQYHCADHDLRPPLSQFLTLASNALTTAREDHGASLSPSKKEPTTKTTLASIYLVKNTRITSATNNLVSTTKVKRKTSDPPPPETSSFSSQNTTAVVTTRTTKEPTTTVKLPVTAQATSTTSEASTELTSTEQPEGSVRIVINGTINCTAELSSTSLPLNFTSNDTDAEELDKTKDTKESHPRTPLIDVSTLEDNTFSPNDIITDRNVYGDFDEKESFVINVTSSLRANTSHLSTAKPAISKPTPTVTKVSIPTDIAEALNSTKKTKGDYDFDYTEPTLPPSLPNLKIIPFVAADAVVEEKHPKEPLPYPHDREDKFPVYYPAISDKDTSFTRREDVYHSTQYPVFITDKGDEQYPSLSQDVGPTSSSYYNADNDLGPSGSEYTLPTSIQGRFDQNKAAVTPQPVPRTTFNVESPKVNLFSPPVETEGGFVPQGPSRLIDEYYAVFPSTPRAPAVPRLTTSMPLDITKEGECVSSDGRRIPSGGTISVACSECTCTWGALHCTPRACAAPPPRCRRRTSSTSSGDLCCGELICDEENKLTTTHETTTVKQTTTPVSYTTKAPDETSKTTTEVATSSPIAYVTQKTVDAASTSTYNDAHGQIHQPQKAPDAIAVDKIKINTLDNFTAAATTTEREDHFTKPIVLSTTPAPPSKEQEPEESLEYEEEEEEGGFSFGNVLKLLLSGDRYDTTTTAPKRIPTTSRPPLVKLTTTTRARTPVAQPTVSPFMPLPALPFLHAKLSQNSINRIDHLVLGEATAIKRTTVRPLAPPPRPHPATTGTTQAEVTRREEHHTSTETAWPPAGGGLSGFSGGLLKLAGCNIYGRMYRVGRIIAELSTPCQECWCTELGVQCKDLKC